MKVLLVHHAEAVSPTVDPQRPLSVLGHDQADALAVRARDAGFVPGAIWHSGKLRARQTAECFLRRCNASAEFRMVRGLRPEDPPAWMRDELRVEDRDMTLVGHMPNISALARALDSASGGVPLHGFVLLERDGDSGWRILSLG